MRAHLCVTIIVAVVLCVQVLVEFTYAAPAGQQQQPQQQQQQQQNPWLLRKAEFYRNTTFKLSEENVRLLGGKYSQTRLAHLPFWFDFELFKKVFNKSYPDSGLEAARHRIYITTCVRTLKGRVMYNILASNERPTITGQADLSFIERIPTEAPSGIINGPAQGGLEKGAPGESRPSIEFAAELEPDLGLDLESDSSEGPLERALRLVRCELARVESRNQLENYLKAFEELDGSAIEGQLPY